MIRIMCVLVCSVLASPAAAAVIFSQTNEVFSAGTTDCATIASTGGYSACRELNNVGATSDVSIVNSIPNYTGSMPSGTKVMRVTSSAITAQSDAGVQIGNADDAGYENYIPANAWWQVVMYIPNNGTESPSTLDDRPMKLFYPCMGSYPCTSSTGNYFLIETSTVSSYQPFANTSLAGTSTGDMWIASRDNTLGTPCWSGWSTIPGYSAAECKLLGQTDISERLRPNRWQVVRCHNDFTNTSAAVLECWIGAFGSPLTKVLSWTGGTTIAGYSFSWTIPTAKGHRGMWYPSTQPAPNHFPQVLTVYYDDFYLATSEADLPSYTGGSKTLDTGTNLLRSEWELAVDALVARVDGLERAMMSLNLSVAAQVGQLGRELDQQTAKWSGVCRASMAMGGSATSYAGRMRREIPC